MTTKCNLMNVSNFQGLCVALKFDGKHSTSQ